MGTFQNQANALLGTVAAGTMMVNKALEPAAAQFTKEATEAAENAEQGRQEAQKKVAEAVIGQHDLERPMAEANQMSQYMKENVTSMDPKDIDEFTGKTQLTKKMNDLDAARKANLVQAEKATAKRDMLNRRLSHNNTILDRIRNSRMTGELNHENTINRFFDEAIANTKEIMDRRNK